MAYIKTLMAGVAEVLSGMTGTGAVTGEVRGIPPSGSRGVEGRFLTVQIVFSADPGAYVYNLMGSLDGVTYMLLETTLLSKTTVNVIAQIRTNVVAVRLDQVSKANAVTAIPILMVA